MAELVGVLGGTFDPIHRGHLHLARAVRMRFELNRMLLVPSAKPPHKTGRELTSAEHRLAMVRLAVEGARNLVASDVEIVRGGVSYTIDTLRGLRDGEPPVAPLFVVGMDAVCGVLDWREGASLLREFDLIAVDRHPVELDPRISRRVLPLPENADELPLTRLRPGLGGRIFRLPVDPLPVSSSAVRARSAAGEPLDELVPAAVAEYIQRHGIYRSMRSEH